MITANEAVQLYDASGAEAEAYLATNFDKQVRICVEGGKRTYFHFIGSDEVRFFDERKHISPLLSQVMDRLKGHGFNVKFVLDKSHQYVPRGLSDDDGNGPVHANYGIQISW